jgi:heparan-alpha-glucosaminide N-acetyltransferase
VTPVPTLAPPPPRIASVDAYRGLVMLLMMAEVLHLGRVARNLPGSDLWALLAFHQTHAPWRGCSLHDLIQPSFSFLVGVALPFSLAARKARGEPGWATTLHALWRSAVLVALGVFLRSVGKPRTNFTFEDTLSQIGLGYFFLFLLGHTRRGVQWAAVAVILVGYWAAFAAYPLPGPNFDWQAVGVPPDWPHLSGFAAHWDKNANLAWAFDREFLNLFPREKPFTHNPGGYATLSFIPTLATMVLGLIAGGWLREPGAPWGKVRRFALAGVLLLAAGWGLDAAGVCPSVKRIWTPSWVLFSGGWCFLFLAAFSAVLDTGGPQGWAFPLRVVGANSIAAYCMAHLIDGFILESFKTHLGQDVFSRFGPYEPLASGAAVLGVLWLILLWMYRRRVFLKI